MLLANFILGTTAIHAFSGSQFDSNLHTSALYWAIQYDDASNEVLRNIWKSKVQPVLPEGVKLVPQPTFHTTLLFEGGHPSDAMKDKDREYLQYEGRSVKVKLRDVVWDRRIVAVEVMILGENERRLCENVHSHITLALNAHRGVMALESNLLLARRAAAENFTATTLHEWLLQLGGPVVKLQNYTDGIMQWCQAKSSRKPCSPFVLERHSAEIAKVLEATDSKKHAQLEAYLRKPTKLHVVSIRDLGDVTLQGVIHGF